MDDCQCHLKVPTLFRRFDRIVPPSDRVECQRYAPWSLIQKRAASLLMGRVQAGNPQGTYPETVLGHLLFCERCLRDL